MRGITLDHRIVRVLQNLSADLHPYMRCQLLQLNYSFAQSLYNTPPYHTGVPYRPLHTHTVWQVFDSSLRKGRRFTTKIGVGRVIQVWFIFGRSFCVGIVVLTYQSQFNPGVQKSLLFSSSVKGFSAFIQQALNSV